MNVLDTEISFFKNCFDADNPINGGTFLQIVTSEKLVSQYRPLVDRIRATADPAERKRLKEKLPCFTPSGLFRKHDKDGLIKHSGLLSFDLDAGKNPFLNAGTVEAVKAEICKLPEVAFCQISASGTGLWGVVILAYPERHEEQFEALKAAFAKKVYVVDSACKDIPRLRFWSYDPAQYINPNAIPFAGLPKRTPEPPRPSFARGHLAGPPPDDLPAQAAAYLVKNRVPLECTYANFMRIAFACKHAWGDAGKDTALDILHACTTFSQSNTARKFDTLWRNIKRENGTTTTAGTLVHIAKEHGFKYAAQGAPLPTWTPNTTMPAPMPAPKVEPPTAPHSAPDAANWQTVTVNGTTFEQRPAPEAIATNIRDNAAALCEAAGWIKTGNWQPWTAADEAAYLRIMERQKAAQESRKTILN